MNGRTKWPSPSNRYLKTGDFVGIVEPTNQRGFYPLAHVIKLKFGSDAVDRSAEVRTASGNMIRPFVKLAPVPIKNCIHQRLSPFIIGLVIASGYEYRLHD